MEIPESLEDVVVPDDIKELNAHDLACQIQPLWIRTQLHEKEEQLSEEEALRLLAMMKSWTERGLDMEYWFIGAGSPGACTLF